MFHSSTRPFYAPFFFHPTSNGFFWWICRYGGYKGKLASHISLSQRPDPKEKHVISLDQDVQVCGYIYWWMVDETPLYDFSLPCNIFGMGYIFFFSFSLFFDTPCGCVAYLLWVCIFSLFFDMPCGHVAYLLWVCIFYFFLYSPYLWREIDMVQHRVLFVDGWLDVLSIFQCRSIACE